MYVCMYVCMYVRMYVCGEQRKPVYQCRFMYVCTYVCMYVCMYAASKGSMYINVGLCMYVYVCMYVLMYVCGEQRKPAYQCRFMYVCTYVCMRRAIMYCLLILYCLSLSGLYINVFIKITATQIMPCLSLSLVYTQGQ
jgi:hypothetical protein